MQILLYFIVELLKFIPLKLLLFSTRDEQKWCRKKLGRSRDQFSMHEEEAEMIHGFAEQMSSHGVSSEMMLTSDDESIEDPYPGLECCDKDVCNYKRSSTVYVAIGAQSNSKL